VSTEVGIDDNLVAVTARIHVRHCISPMMQLTRFSNQVRAREEDCRRPDGTMAKVPGNYGFRDHRELGWRSYPPPRFRAPFVMTLQPASPATTQIDQPSQLEADGGAWSRRTSAGRISPVCSTDALGVPR
jgi:hypothetical protein